MRSGCGGKFSRQAGYLVNLDDVEGSKLSSCEMVQDGDFAWQALYPGPLQSKNVFQIFSIFMFRGVPNI